MDRQAVGCTLVWGRPSAVQAFFRYARALSDRATLVVTRRGLRPRPHPTAAPARPLHTPTRAPHIRRQMRARAFRHDFRHIHGHDGGRPSNSTPNTTPAQQQRGPPAPAPTIRDDSRPPPRDPRSPARFAGPRSGGPPLHDSGGFREWTPRISSSTMPAPRNRPGR
jgi:hypothetical protein